MADIKHAIQIAAKPGKVYPLVATALGFGQWWASDVTEPPGAVELRFFNRATVYRLRLQAAHSSERAEWLCDSGDQWSGTRLIFQLETSASGTLLRFTHAGWRGETDYFVSCNTTWGGLMFRLKAAGEEHSPGPLFQKDGIAY